MRGYLCGGINGLSDSEAMDWREQAKLDIPEIEWVDPMARDYRGKESENVREIVESDLADIASCDIVNCMLPVIWMMQVLKKKRGRRVTRPPINQIGSTKVVCTCCGVYLASKRMSCAPCHSTLVPSARRFSLPSTMVRKWLPANCPILLEKLHAP